MFCYITELENTNNKKIDLDVKLKNIICRQNDKYISVIYNKYNQEYLLYHEMFKNPLYIISESENTPNEILEIYENINNTIDEYDSLESIIFDIINKINKIDTIKQINGINGINRINKKKS